MFSLAATPPSPKFLARLRPVGLTEVDENCTHLCLQLRPSTQYTCALTTIPIVSTRLHLQVQSLWSLGKFFTCTVIDTQLLHRPTGLWVDCIGWVGLVERLVEYLPRSDELSNGVQSRRLSLSTHESCSQS